MGDFRQSSHPHGNRSGLPRRKLLQAGLTGFTTLSMADVFRLQAAATADTISPGTAVIMVWLRGGASHLETFDPKPEAPSEFRGPYSAIDTNVAGIQVC